MGSSSENSAFGPTRQPLGPRAHSRRLVERGAPSPSPRAWCPSPSGRPRAAACASPAGLCGIVGFKPTYGRVSRYGLVAFGSSLDQVSPFARSVRDAALVRERRVRTRPRSTPPRSTARRSRPPGPARLEGLRIGVPRELVSEGVDAEVRKLVDEGIARPGGTRGRADRALAPPPGARHRDLLRHRGRPRASSNLARYDGVRYGTRVDGGREPAGHGSRATREAGFGDEVKRRILLGTYVLSAGYADRWYRRALKVRRLIADDFERAFEEVDLIASPTSPHTRVPAGRARPGPGVDVPLRRDDGAGEPRGPPRGQRPGRPHPRR